MIGIKRIERSALFIPITSYQGARHDVLPIGCSELHFLQIRTIYKYCPFLTPSQQVSVSNLHLIYSPDDCLKKQSCSYRRYWKRRIQRNACCDLVSTKPMSRPEGAILSILVLENWLRRLTSGLEGRRYLNRGTHYFYNCSLILGLQGISRRES